MSAPSATTQGELDAAEAAAQLTALEAARLRGFVDGAEVSVAKSDSKLYPTP